MAERIFTLFGEEIIPEQINAVGKSRAKKKPEGPKPEPETKTTPAAPAAEQPESKPAIEAPAFERIQQPEPVPIITLQPQGDAVAPQKPTAKKQKRELEEEMELPDGWKGDKQYYSIGEVAGLFNVKTSHIRFWTNEFKLKVRTTRKGDRLYTPAQVRALKTIHHLVKEQGYTLAGAKAKLKEGNNIVAETVDLKQSLLQLRNKLVIIRNQLA